MSGYSSSISDASTPKRRFHPALATAILLATLGYNAPRAHQNPELVPPSVPDRLQVPAGHTAVRVARAAGTQNYICVATTGGFGWTFLGPQATLFSAEGTQIMTHFLSSNPNQGGAARPTWQDSGDTSVVWAAPIASYAESDYVEAESIPWLLLQVVGSQSGPTGGQTIAGTTYIQRVNTLGGIAPSAGCRRAQDIGTKALVPYTTDYVFYRAQ